jgi:glycosyltransferase involved in cell wall biosynthesis
LFWNIAGSRFGKIWLWLIRKVDFMGVRGDNSKAYLINQGISPQKIFIPPNVFDFNRFSPQKQDPKYQVITVGSLVSDKRIDILLQAIAWAKQKIDHIKVAIVGSGRLEKKLRKIADRLNLTNNIDFLGTQIRVEDYLNASRIFVLTSRTEGLPMAMIEALSCGLPVIVPEVGDISTVAKDGVNALLVKPPTSDALAQAIIRLLTDERLYARLAQNALKIRQDYMLEYSLENALRVWDKILGQL